MVHSCVLARSGGLRPSVEPCCRGDPVGTGQGAQGEVVCEGRTQPPPRWGLSCRAAPAPRPGHFPGRSTHPGPRHGDGGHEHKGKEGKQFELLGLFFFFLSMFLT